MITDSEDIDDIEQTVESVDFVSDFEFIDFLVDKWRVLSRVVARTYEMRLYWQSGSLLSMKWEIPSLMMSLIYLQLESSMSSLSCGERGKSCLLICRMEYTNGQSHKH